MLTPFLQQNNRVATSILWCGGDQSGRKRGLAAHQLIREMGVLSIFSFLDSPGQFRQRRLVGVDSIVHSSGVSAADANLQNPGARDGRCEDATVALSKWGYAVRPRGEAGVGWLRRFARQDEPDPSDNCPCPHLFPCSDPGPNETSVLCNSFPSWAGTVGRSGPDTTPVTQHPPLRSLSRRSEIMEHYRLDHKLRGPGSNDMGAMGVVHAEMSSEPSVDRRCYASSTNRHQGASDRGLSAHTKRGLSRQG